MMRFVLLLLALDDYHVSPSGDDAHPGTAERPWKTPARVSAQVLRPGDRVLFEGGRTFRGGIALDEQDAGTRERPVRIGSYGTG
ncbi:MAG TPA: beta-glucosidase, partial [Planctomycetota bacterium]|nr:beta-glucosidase [Planctomycetota bacterium]